MENAPFIGKFLNTVEFSGTRSNSWSHIWVTNVSPLMNRLRNVAGKLNIVQPAYCLIFVH